MITRNKIPILLLFLVMATVAMAGAPNYIPYQGSLTQSGGAAIPDAAYKMRFGIYNAPSGGIGCWGETQPAVQVTGGLFSVNLGTVTALFDQLFIPYPELYLEVEVDLNGNETFEADELYLPRQLIVCPYLRSHADNICTGTTTFIGASKGMTPSDAPLQVNPTGVDPNDVLFSVWTSGSNYVLVGDQGSLEATGVIQAGTNALPAAYSRIGPGTATWGAITDSNDMLVTDDLEVGGNIYWGDATRYYAVTASDFQADHEHIWGFYRTATTLEKDSGDLNEQGWYAPIHLPHFATVTMFTVYYYDNSASDLTFELRRRTYGFALAGETMAQVATSLTPGETYGADSTIDNAQILNNSYNYYIYFVFPAADTGSSLAFRNARITYTTARP